MKIRFFLLMAVCCTSQASLSYASSLEYPSIWECDTAKPNWYCDEVVSKDAEVAKTQPTIPNDSSLIELKDIKTAEELRNEVKRRLDIATMQPTTQNVRAFLEANQFVQDKGALFADNWQRVVWTAPEFDYSLRRPANNTAIKAFDQIRNLDEEAQLRALAKEHGFIFFFSSNCPYCHRMAPTLKMLVDKYGIEVLPVSLDGGSLLGFSNVVMNAGQAQSWRVERVPALFIASKKTGEHAPIGFGMMSLSEIVARVFTLTATQAGQRF